MGLTQLSGFGSLGGGVPLLHPPLSAPEVSPELCQAPCLPQLWALAVQGSPRLWQHQLAGRLSPGAAPPALFLFQF